MSEHMHRVGCLIVKKRFGPVVEKVVDYLWSHAASPLQNIQKKTELPLSTVKETLRILIKYGLVRFSTIKYGTKPHYSLNGDKILLMIRYPKYIELIKNKFGDEAAVIMEELLPRSYWTASEIILKVTENMSKNEKKVSLAQTKEKFMQLVIAKYLRRVPKGDLEAAVPKLEMLEEEAHIPPTIDMRLLSLAESGAAIPQSFPDKGVHWMVDFDRFHQDMRDNLYVLAATNRIDEHAGELMKLLLQQMYIRTEPWATVSNPIPLVEIKNIIRKQQGRQPLLKYFDEYVQVLKEERFIAEATMAGEGSVEIKLSDTMTRLTWETIEQGIQAKFGKKGARIFRSLKMDPYMQVDEIQPKVMILAKDCKHLTYTLHGENYILIEELGKAASVGPNKTFYLFYPDLEFIARKTVQDIYRALFNMWTRENHEIDTHQRLIDRRERVNTIVMGMKAQEADEEQITEVEEIITPLVREILDNIDKLMKKINAVEDELDNNLFLLETYIRYTMIERM